jgi:hypothetical protein
MVLARISHHSSTVAALCGIPGDFQSVRALNSVSTMPAHPPDNDCLRWQSLSGVVAKDTWDTTFHRLGNCSCIALLRSAGPPHIHVRIATKGGEKCGLALTA